MIITKTPFRVSLLGGGTDMPAWYKENGGSVVSFSIDKYCYLTTRILPPFFEHKYRVAYSKVETTLQIDQIEHPVVRESIRKYALNLNLEIHHDGDLPARSGVGSSSAFTVGMIHSLLSLQGIETNQVELANFAIDLEQNILRENVGSQDQIACAIGGLNFLSFGPDDSWNHTKLQINNLKKSSLEDRMVLIFTGVSRNSSEINKNFIDKIPHHSKYLKRLQELSINCRDAISNSSDLDQIGEMLNENWELKRAINKNATSSNLDELYVKAIRSGALGGKILGAGGGGFYLFWVKEGQKKDFLERFKSGVHVPFKISDEGSRVVYNSATKEESGAI